MAVGDPWHHILSTLKELVPVSGAVAYGSSLVGPAGKDYDVLAIVDDPSLVHRRSELQECLGQQTGLPVDLVLATVEGLYRQARNDPYLWHVLASGRQVGHVPSAPRTITRRAARLALLRAEMLLEEMEALGLVGEERGGWIRQIAKLLAALEQAMTGKADPQGYAQRVKELESEFMMTNCIDELRNALSDDVDVARFSGRLRL